MNSVPTSKLREQAALIIAVLQGFHFQPHIVGGVLRAEMLGGTTKDIDVAVLVGEQDITAIKSLLERFAYVCAHENESEYTEQSGFWADYRLGDVNVILYNSQTYRTLDALVSSFDLNINMYYERGGSVLNNYFDGTVVTYTHDIKHAQKPERIARFRREYPELDWSQVC